MSERPDSEIPLQPDKLTGLRIGRPKQSAAGLPGVVSALRHVFGELRVVRGVSTLLRLNQKRGIDCPGCAWPDPDDERSRHEYCENGAKAIAEEATQKKITGEFFRQYSVTDLKQKSDFWLGKQGRLSEPVVLRSGSDHYEIIEWEQAFGLIADELNRLSSPNEAVFYTSGRTSNEAAFLYQLFVRQYGTNNMPDCSNMCHESSGVGLTETVGIGKGSVMLEDLHVADVIFVLGQNPGTNHPRMLSALERAKRNGCRIIAANPLKESGLLKFNNPKEAGGMLGRGTALTDLFLQIRINGDVALLKAIMRIMLDAEDQKPGSVFDHSFIAEFTDGYEQFIADLRQYDPAQLAEDCGAPLTDIAAAADMLIQNEKIIVCWAMGLTQHVNGVANIQEIVNLLLLRGSIGKPGAGTCPVRGHSNVQGDRTMGIWEKPPAEFLKRLGATFNFRPPTEHGFDTVEAIQAMADGRAKVFFGMGGNFYSAAPDSDVTAQALQNCRLTAHVSTKLNRSHLVHGQTALILPCLARTDRDEQDSTVQFVTVENSMGRVHASHGMLTPVSEQLKSEPAIVAGLARATLGDRTTVDWEHLVADYDRIRDAIAATIPEFAGYNERVRRPGGFDLPNGARERRFDTPTGKARFTKHAPPVLRLEPDEFIMMTIRSHDQFNTTIYGMNDRYRGVYNERRVVLMNIADVESAGLCAGDIVIIESDYAGVVRTGRNFVIVVYDIPRRCVATYFPEANTLVPLGQTAAGSNTPASKMVRVRIFSTPET